MLDKPSRGQVYLNGTAIIKKFTGFKLPSWKVGLCLQDFNLLDTLSVKDNILLPCLVKKTHYRNDEKLVVTAENLGINQLQRNPYEISGGQKACSSSPAPSSQSLKFSLPMSQEPLTPNHLALLDVFDEINERRQTILMVTHSTAAANGLNVFFSSRTAFFTKSTVEKTERQMFQKFLTPWLSWQARWISMFRLTNKLAVSNLIKNRKLYYPFLAVLLAVTVTYLLLPNVQSQDCGYVERPLFEFTHN